MKQVFIAFAALIIILNFGCKKKNDDANTSEIIESINVRQVSNDSLLSTSKYSYDAAGKLIGINNSAGSSQQFKYNAQGQLLTFKLIEANSRDIFLDSFIYNTNGLIVKKISTPLLVNFSTDDHAYAYNAQGKLIADTQFSKSLTTVYISGYNVYEYDNNENVTTVRYYQSTPGATPVLKNIETDTYDNKINPYYKMGNILYMAGATDMNFLSKHNVVSAQATFTTNPAIPTTPYFSNFSYYSNGVPRTVIRGTLNNPGSAKLEYFYK